MAWISHGLEQLVMGDLGTAVSANASGFASAPHLLRMTAGENGGRLHVTLVV